MKRLSLLAVLAFAASFSAHLATAQTTASTETTANDASPEANLDAYLWIKRPLVVFADTPNDPRFVTQMQMLQDEAEALEERDVVVLADTDPDAKSELRIELRPRGFQVVLLGKDGQVKLRKPLPWDVRELSRTIDKMPMRQQEMRR